jgi:membrane protein YqaA with SNARE-associated domain
MDTIVEFLRQFGAWGLFVHSIIDAIFFPIPAFFTQVSLSLLDPEGALLLATVGFVGCLIGTPVGYGIGKLSGKVLLHKLLKKRWVDAATAMFGKNGEAAILIGSFTPIPFKVFTILSGGLNFPLWKLMVYAAIGRAAKFYVVGALFYLYGQSAEGMVKQVSLYIFLIAVPLLAIGFAVKRKLANRAKRKAEEEGETRPLAPLSASRGEEA